MQLHLAHSEGLYVIRSYGPGRVVVNDERYASSLVVMPDRLLAGWPPERFEDLEAAHFDAVAALEPEVVIVGTGGRLRFPAASLTAPLSGAGIGFEIMDTTAACRTYNVLAHEGRRVAAALLMP